MKKQFKIVMLALVFCAISAVAVTALSATPTTADVVSGEWQQNSIGWWYENPDGSYPVNTWQFIDDEWFHFNQYGYMTTGWLFSGGHWYFLHSNGIMAEGWTGISGKDYYFNYYYGDMATSEWINYDYYVGADGAYIPGTQSSCWRQDSNGWWFENPDGSYLRNTWQALESGLYHFDAHGYMSTGWVQDNDKWYFFNTNGSRAGGWIKYNGKDYYLYEESGYMATSEWINYDYYVGADGAYIPGTQSSCWRQDSNGWWFRLPDGSYPKDCNYIINDSTYLFDAKGYMLADKWVGYYVNNSPLWSYYKKNGQLAESEWVGNYFFNIAGYMCTNEWVGEYYVSENGLYSGERCVHDWANITDNEPPIDPVYYYPYPQADWNNFLEGFVYGCTKCSAYLPLNDPQESS